MFVRGALRALARGRRLGAAGAGDPDAVSHAAFRLTRYADGRLTLDDPSTGAHLQRRACGAATAAACAALLPAPAR